MGKKGIITLSIFAVLLALIGVLFGAVFCVRTQKVTVEGAGIVDITKNDIVKAGEIKKGKSIFLLDKESAIEKIEKTYPKIKVIQIKTESITKINIRVRLRYEMFYAELNNQYYVMDEDLKVLKITAQITDVENLTKLKADDIKLTKSTHLADFVGTNKQRKITSSLYHAMITTFKKDSGGDKVYFERADVIDMIKSVDFETFNTFDKIIIKTKYGVKLDIENPKDDLQNKINICAATINTFLKYNEDEIDTNNDKEKSGTIRIYFDLEDKQHCIYIPEVTE